jgi:DNA-binding NarL/FixJ family response regulator
MATEISYRILLADDHPRIRRGIRKMIEKIPELQVVGEVGDGIELLEFLEKCKTDMVISDLSMPKMGGIEATRKIKANYPEIKVMITTIHNDIEYQNRVLSAGAEGYLLKDSLAEELFPAITTIRQGGTYAVPL